MQTELYSLPDKFVIKKGQSFATVDRKTGAISTSSSSQDASSSSKVSSFGVLGNIRLIGGYYIVSIKSATKVGDIFPGHTIYQANQIELLPYDANGAKNLDAQQASDEQQYISLLTGLFLKTPHSFYFSETFDLSTSLQKQFSQGFSLKSQSNDWKNVDELFVWNRHLAREFTANDAASFCVPLVRGFIELKNINIDGTDMQFAIVSRLGWKRVGTRYFTRGVDEQGHVANFAETEQIITLKGVIKSFLQIRGSIPLKWSQKPNLKYKPKVVVQEEKSSGFKPHMDLLVSRYQKLVFVNLVDQSPGKSEKIIADAYQKNVAALGNSNIRYVGFDFHHETKKMRYENIQKLVVEVERDLKEFGYFSYDMNSNKVLTTQSGTARVNCIDCLDRTNVVQSVFGRLFLVHQLQNVGLLKSTETLNNKPELEKLFKNVWADNGDALSFMYSGTGALKSDFTRTGKRTKMGVLQDGMNSVTRYYLNNFKDGVTVDALNLLLGKYIVDAKEESPFAVVKKNSTRTLLNKGIFAAFFVGAILTVFNIFKIPGAMLTSGEQVKNRSLASVVFGIITFLLYTILVSNGRRIVNNPILKNKKTKSQ